MALFIKMFVCQTSCCCGIQTFHLVLQQFLDIWWQLPQDELLLQIVNGDLLSSVADEC